MGSVDSRHAASIMPRPGRDNNRIPGASSHRSPGRLQRIRNADLGMHDDQELVGITGSL